MKDYFTIFSKVAQYERVNMISNKIAKSMKHVKLRKTVKAKTQKFE